jgi:hypothetical protein
VWAAEKNWEGEGWKENKYHELPVGEDVKMMTCFVGVVKSYLLVRYLVWVFYWREKSQTPTRPATTNTKSSSTPDDNDKTPQ